MRSLGTAPQWWALLMKTLRFHTSFLKPREGGSRTLGVSEGLWEGHLCSVSPNVAVRRYAILTAQTRHVGPVSQPRTIPPRSSF